MKNIIAKVDTFLSGKKSYLISIATITGAIAFYYNGQIGSYDALQLVLGALGLYTLRDAVKKK